MNKRYPDIIRIMTGGIPISEEIHNRIADAIDAELQKAGLLPEEVFTPLESGPENVAGTWNEIIQQNERSKQ